MSRNIHGTSLLTPFDLNRILIGTYYGWNSRSYKGLIEEATFWKRTLSDQEIRLSRHLTKSDISDTDLIAYYQFNHINGAKIYDKKGGYDLQRNLAVGLKPSDAPVGPGTSKLLNYNIWRNKRFIQQQMLK